MTRRRESYALLASLLLTFSLHAQVRQRVFDGTPLGNLANELGRAQIAFNGVLWLDALGKSVRWFDMDGRDAYKNRIVFPLEEGFLSVLSPLQDDVLAFEGVVYLSVNHKLAAWELGSGDQVLDLELPNRFRLIHPLDDGFLIALPPDGEGLVAVVDGDGRMLRRIGTALASGLDSWDGNDYFAFFVEGNVVVLFQYYPVYRIYNLAGDLMSEGEYETSPYTREGMKQSPPLEQVIADGRTPESMFKPFMMAEFHEGRYFLASTTTITVLDKDFGLVYFRALPDLSKGFVPQILDIDAAGNRLLVRELSMSQPRSYERLSLIPIGVRWR